MASNGAERWQAVTRREPCPACGGVDWCAWRGGKLRCMRAGNCPHGMTTLWPDADGGTWFAPATDRRRNGAPRQQHAPPQSARVDGRQKLDKLAKRFQAGMTAERLDALAAALGVTTTSLTALGVGWASADDLLAMKAGGAGWSDARPDGAFTFPERDSAGSVVGFSLRTADGRKGAPSSASGAKRGLIVPAGLHDYRNVVLVVEGASDVAACGVLGLPAVGRPSNSGGAELLGKLLRNRPLLVVGENDAKPTGAWPGRDGAERVATRLATGRSEAVAWALPPREWKDLRDWLAARVAGGLNLADADACRAAGAELLAALQTAKTMAEAQQTPTAAEQLVRLALELYRFGRTDTDEVFAVPHSGPNIAIMLKGSAEALRAKLAREYRAQTGRTPAASALADALNVLAGEALDAEAEAVHLRLAAYENGVIIDLADAEGRAVVVRPGAWQVVEQSPVLFRRTALTGALPIPERGGNLAELRELLNVSGEDWALIVGWLVAALLPDIPHAVLLLSGLQGTGKSCAARALVTLFDPSPAPLRSEPRDLEQWQIAASGSWAVCLDNLSGIRPWLADAICRAATGDGLVKRKLYTDGDLAVLAFRRVVVLTSIDPGALRGDMGERLLLVDLDKIPNADRRTEQEMDSMLAERRPRLLGALLDALAIVLAKLPDVRPPQLPRMADFARVLAAADAAGVTDGALDQFLGQQGRIAAEVVEADPFGAALVEFVRVRGEWQGTATELLAELLENGTDKAPHGWPKANGVKGRLKRLTPALAEQGVVVAFDRAGHSRRRTITLESSRAEPSESSAGADAPENTGLAADGHADNESIARGGGRPPETSAATAPPDSADGADDRPRLLSNTAGGADEWGEI